MFSAICWFNYRSVIHPKLTGKALLVAETLLGTWMVRSLGTSQSKLGMLMQHSHSARIKITAQHRTARPRCEAACCNISPFLTPLGPTDGVMPLLTAIQDRLELELAVLMLMHALHVLVRDLIPLAFT